MWAGDHPNSDADEGSFPARRLRLGSCMTGGVEGSRSCIHGGVECSSPARMVVYRLLTIVRKCRGGKRVAVEERENKESRGSKIREKIDGECDGDRRRSPVRVSENRSANRPSGCHGQEMSFNLAAGLGLLSLIAASKTELNRTMELRREMEVFLTNIRDEHHSNAATPKPSDPRVAYAVSTTLDGISNASPYSIEEHAPLSQQESGISMVYDEDEHGEIHEREASMEGFNHLEEELAAELERMHADEETGVSSENLEGARVQNLIHPTDTVTQSITVSTGEVIDPQNAGIPDYYGVPPLELERRLHELLEARQEERIKELETHLECMKKRLEEKEVEVTWWKDTAKLISKQVPEPSRLLR